MITETIEAWQLEEGDFITLGGDAVFRVAYLTDEGESVCIVLEDEDGEIDRENPLFFTPWDEIEFFVSRDD